MLEKKNDYDWDYIDESILELENETPNLCRRKRGRKAKLEEIREAVAGLEARAEAGEFGEGIDLGSLDISVKVSGKTTGKSILNRQRSALWLSLHGRNINRHREKG